MPVNFQPQDRDAYWANDPDMKLKTEKYYEEVEKLIKRGFTDFQVGHPWEDRGRCSIPKAYILELEGDHFQTCQDTHEFSNPREMYLHFEQHRLKSSKVTRQLLILEDLDPRFAELLGVKLEIPPAFFLAHCDEWAYVRLIDRKYAKQDRSRYWKVRVPQTRSLPHNHTASGTLVVEAGSFYRGKAVIGSNTTKLGFFNHISFWGQKHSEDSWTAIVLLDPRHTSLRVLADDQTTGEGICCLRASSFNRRSLHSEILMEAPREDRKPPHEMSMADALWEAHSQTKIPTSENPFSATTIIQNIIYSIWDDWTFLNGADINDTLLKDEDQHRRYRQTLAPESLRASDNSYEREYENLMETGRLLKRDRSLLKTAIQAFESPESPHVQRKKKSATAVDQQDHHWRLLDERLAEQEATFQFYMDAFAQRVSMQRSFAANRQARSGAQLTKLATAIVPCTLISSIFSMGGDFAAGERFFGVYWAIVVPMTVVMLTWVLFSDQISDVWEKYKKYRKDWKGWKPKVKNVYSRTPKKKEQDSREC